MLRQPLKLVENHTHEELFLERYDHLMKWAVHLAGNDRQLAEDLLQEAFVQFTVSRPDLSDIKNVDSYVYGILRHLHLAHVRNAANQRFHQFSLLECDSAEIGLRKGSVLTDIQVRDELQGICEFACFRKETSKAASVLILRFFHGYYPREIADVLNNSIQTVKVWLHTARVEVRIHLNDPEKLKFLRADKPKQLSNKHDFIASRDTAAVLADLRETIFDAISGKHMPEARLAELYGRTVDEIAAALSVGELSHLVSCAGCLDQVNMTLDLPLLADRYPTDMIGKDSNRNDGDGGSGHSSGYDSGDGSGGPPNSDPGTLLRKRAREVFEHFPRELQVAVNGYVQTAQKINSAESEFSLSLADDEPVSFIEIYGGQQTRLMLMPVVSPPPEGPLEQSESIALSENRRLDLQLVFSSPKPTLQVVYSDPTFVPDDVQASFATLNLSEINQLSPNSVRDAVVTHTSQTTSPNRHNVTYRDPVSEAEFEINDAGTSKAALTGDSAPLSVPLSDEKSRLASFFAGWKSLLRPVRLTTAFAALLIATLLIVKFFAPSTVSAAELLQKSAAAEDARLANKERILHRTIDLEEYDANGQNKSRKKIDVWQSSEKGITARRLYDDQGRLSMGDWRRADGVQTIYQRGEAAKLRLLPEAGARPIGFDDAWQLSVSAKEFIALLGPMTDAQVETRANDYVITHTPDAGGNRAGITKATIVLSRDDLRAVEQTFTLRNGDETRGFRFVESSYEWKPANAVAPAVFEPNVELIGGATDPGAHREIRIEADTNIVEQPAANVETSPAANIATAALELEVVEALNQAGAFTGEQISVARTQDGKILVSAVLEATERKKALLAALANVRNNPAVRIKIETVEEIAARRRASSKNSAQPTIVDQVEADESSNPMLVELRERLSDDGARRFASGVIARSRLVRQRALAIKQISGRFSATDLQTLTPAERRRLLSLIRGHANAFEREAQALLRDLQKVFPDLGGGEGRSVTIGGDAELQARIHELFDAAIAIENGTGSSFASGGKSSGPSPVKTVTFWRSLSNAAAIAKSLQLVK